ncbi:unnamed protein product [Rotaria magnacalcarata]|uniref:Uncharacterized protein n=2 Tax=Rotaria magnacalcarata TaxID=392030 RepID=A0A8S2PFR5_9BILA|nr:unnamed protein product [Rotaria magnacalcarata]
MNGVLKQGNSLVSVSAYPSQFQNTNGVRYDYGSIANDVTLVIAWDSNHVSHIIPGWRYGCYVDVALFASTLECYYYTI